MMVTNALINQLETPELRREFRAQHSLVSYVLWFEHPNPCIPLTTMRIWWSSIQNRGLSPTALQVWRYLANSDRDLWSMERRPRGIDRREWDRTAASTANPQGQGQQQPSPPNHLDEYRRACGIAARLVGLLGLLDVLGDGRPVYYARSRMLRDSKQGEVCQGMYLLLLSAAKVPVAMAMIVDSGFVLM